MIAGVGQGELVQNQLHTILDSGSPLLQSAETKAAQQSAARGLQNSTLGVQAGQEALINTALPIAQQDATTTANRASQNLQTENNFGLQAAGFGGQAQLAEQQGQIQSQLSAQGARQTSQLTAQQAQAQMDQLKQSGAQSLQQIQQQTQGQVTLAQMSEAHDQVMAQINAGNQLTLDSQQFQHQQALLVTQYGNSLGLSAADNQQQLERLNAQNQYTLQQISAQTSQQLAGYSANLGSQYLASVSNRMNQGSQEITQIYSTQGLTSAQQQAAVQVAYSHMDQDIKAIATYYQQSPQWNPNWNNGAPISTTPQSPPPAPPPPAHFPPNR